MAKTLLSALLFVVAAGTAALSQPLEPTLFHIKRSMNSNQLDYRARFVNCKWVSNGPIHPRWRMLERGLGQEEELDESGPFRALRLEAKKYFGVDLRSTSPRLVKFAIKSMPDVEIAATLSPTGAGCNPTARARINGKQANLLVVYIHTNARGTAVHYISLHGCDEGKPVIQRIIKSALSSEDRKEAEAKEIARIDSSKLCGTR